MSNHPKHKDIESRVKAGYTDTAVAAELHVDRRAVAAVRTELGIEPKTNSTSLADKLARFSFPTVTGGHTAWDGRINSSGGAPAIRHLGKQYRAAAVAFEQRTGRAPVGHVKADCDYPHCLTPEHLQDDIERRTVRLQLRAVYGLEDPWTKCAEGHPWDEHGRVEPDLTLYCRACGTGRKRRTREARRTEGTL